MLNCNKAHEISVRRYESPCNFTARSQSTGTAAYVDTEVSTGLSRQIFDNNHTPCCKTPRDSLGLSMYFFSRVNSLSNKPDCNRIIRYSLVSPAMFPKPHKALFCKN